MADWQIYLLMAAAISGVASFVMCVVILSRVKSGGDDLSDIWKSLDETSEEITNETRALRSELSLQMVNSIKALGDTLNESGKFAADSANVRMMDLSGQLDMRQRSFQEAITAGMAGIISAEQASLKQLTDMLNQKLTEFSGTITEMIKGADERLASFSLQNEQKLEGIRNTLQERLEEMRATVDEKLQHTLESRIAESFKVVSERLEQVYKGLGEMQTLARGVGDLKKILSNVKTRGIMGEIQLGAILEETLSPGQYVKNYSPRPESREVVEYAVKLPGDDENPVYLPIDAKFPADAYAALQEAYDLGDSSKVEEAAANLRRVLNQCAKDILGKYIDPPVTTDFAIMFLPFEGLYAESVRRGITEEIQRTYRVSVAGPTTMAALLNSLQMGFRTFAIQKRSGEVWQILSAVKSEFDKFESVLKSAQSRLDQANDELEKLVGARTRQIRRKLRDVTKLPELDGVSLLETENGDDEEE
ncbi:MAG: DNA recombination protein RmuC [Synergistaceae bacterium]|jgi:DNA recombination protein RmuC|nr:DNA recombination protein RmuC [Synergistaceae bacterium]